MAASLAPLHSPARYNIRRREPTISVQKERLQDGPFLVRQLPLSFDDGAGVSLYTGQQRTPG